MVVSASGATVVPAPSVAAVGSFKSEDHLSTAFGLAALMQNGFAAGQAGLLKAGQEQQQQQQRWAQDASGGAADQQQQQQQQPQQPQTIQIQAGPPGLIYANGVYYAPVIPSTICTCNSTWLST